MYSLHSLKIRYRALRSKLRMEIKINREIAVAARLANIERIYWATPILVMATLINAIVFFFKEEPAFSVEAQWRMWIFIANFIIAMISIGIWLGARKLKKEKANSRTLAFFQYGVIVFVLSFGVVLALIDQMVMTSIAPMVISATIIGAFYFIRPTCSAIFFGFFFWFYYFGLMHWTSLPSTTLDSNIINGLGTSGLGFALSTITWRNFRKVKLQEAKIEQQQEKLQQLAYEDSLTKLPNRRFLDEIIKLEQGRHRECSLIIFDLDNFKAVNDTFGHPIGDRVLRSLADLFQDCMGKDNILARLGGEEFIILLRNTSQDNAVILAERLRKRLEKHKFLIEKNEISLTASFGVAPLLSTAHSGNYYYLADQALYQAKKQGKNCTVAIQGKDVIDEAIF